MGEPTFPPLALSRSGYCGYLSANYLAPQSRKRIYKNRIILSIVIGHLNVKIEHFD